MSDFWPNIVTVFGSGGLSVVVLKIIDARREKRAQEAKSKLMAERAKRERQARDAGLAADLAERAFDAFESGREDTQRTVNELVTCERRCAALERTVGTLTEQRDALALRVDELEEDNAVLVARVGELEREVALMRLAVDSLLAGERPSSTIATVAPIGRR